MKQYRLIRGPRIIQQLTEEATYSELERNTLRFVPPSERRQFVMNSVQIQNMEFTAFSDSNALEVEALANNQGRRYNPSMLFSSVEFQDEDTPQNISFQSSSGETYHIMPIMLQQNNVKVNCTCLDFRWRFAMYNDQTNTLNGNAPPLYQKTTDRPPNNRLGIPGLCKHLLKLAVELKNSNIVR